MFEDSARYAEFNEDYLDAILKYGDCIRLAEIDEAASLQFGPSSEVIFINWLCRKQLCFAPWKAWYSAHYIGTYVRCSR